MAWVSPRTWSVGEVPTSAMLNQDLRDNPQYLKDGAPALRVTNYPTGGTAVVAGVTAGMIWTDDSTIANYDQGWSFTPPSNAVAVPLAGYYFAQLGVWQDWAGAAGAANHTLGLYQDAVARCQSVYAGTTASHGPAQHSHYLARCGSVGSYFTGNYTRGGSGTVTTYFSAEAAFLRGL